MAYSVNTARRKSDTQSIDSGGWSVVGRLSLILWGGCGCPPPTPGASIEKDRLQDIYRMKTRTVRSTCTGRLMSPYLLSAQSHSCRKVHIYFKRSVCFLGQTNFFFYLLVFYYCLFLLFFLLFFFCLFVFSCHRRKFKRGSIHTAIWYCATRHRDRHRYR